MRNPDPGNQWAEKPLSVRLQQIRLQWINLGARQQGMLDNLILSAEYLEEQLEKHQSAAVPCEKEIPSLAGQAIELTIKLLREIARRHPVVLQETDIEAFILNELNPAKVMADKDRRSCYGLLTLLAKARSAQSAIGHSKMPACTAPLSTVSLGVNGQWFCGTCGASDMEPKCRNLSPADRTCPKCESVPPAAGYCLATGCPLRNPDSSSKPSATAQSWIEEELKDGDRICEAAGVQRTEGGRLPVAKIINAIKGRPVPPHRSGGARVPGTKSA